MSRRPDEARQLVTSNDPAGYMRVEAQTGVVAAESVESGGTQSDRLLEDDDSLRMEQLKGDIAELRKKETMQERRLSEAKSFWENKVLALTQEMDSLRSEVQAREVELQELQCPPHEAPKRLPGPKCLLFVQGHCFNSLTLLVILANMILMFMEYFYKDALKPFRTAVWYANIFFLGYYTLELVLKALLFHCKLLCGPCCFVWWNWVDLLVVVAGILDHFVVPIGLHNGFLDKDNIQDLYFVRLVRCMRLLRALKIVHGLVTADLAWVEQHRFQAFMMGVISFNTVILAFECDGAGLDNVWFYVDRALLVIYAFELALRMAHWGCRFFCHSTDMLWNWLDLIVVLGGVVDQWWEPLLGVIAHCMGMPEMKSAYELEDDEDMGKIMSLMRLTRLLRLLRLVRLVRGIQPLYTLVLGIVQAMQGMFWVVFLTVFFLYVWAIFCVMLVGQGLVFGGRRPPAVVEQIFPNVFESMYVLFKVMNGDQSDIVPLFTVMPITKLGVVTFVVLTNWAILSILTAVVSENMINATETHRQELEQAAQADKAERSKRTLEEIFMGADVDRNSTLTREELIVLLQDEDRCDELADASGLEKADLVHLFDVLSTHHVSDTGEVVFYINREDWMEGLKKQSATATERAVMRLEKRLTTIEKNLAVVEHTVTKESGKTDSAIKDIERKLDGIKEADVLAPLLARLEQRIDAGEAAARASAEKASQETAEVQRMLARLEQRLDADAAAAREAKESTEAALAAAVAKAVRAVPQPAPAPQAFLPGAALEPQRQLEADPFAAIAEAEKQRAFEAAVGCLPPIGWEAQAYSPREEEDLPLPVPKPRFAGAPAERATVSPAGTGEEPIGTMPTGSAPGEGQHERGDPVDPLDHLLN